MSSDDVDMSPDDLKRLVAGDSNSMNDSLD